MAEHIETILRLVAEGKLSAEDADPLLAALSTPRPATHVAPRGPSSDPDDETSEWTVFPKPSTPANPPTPPTAPVPPVAPLASLPHAPARPPLPPDPPASPSNARRQLRIEVVEGGRRVVNLRIPLGLANVAAGLVPGLSAEYGERIREAIRSGSVGTILEVQGDDGDRVVIATE